MKNIPALNIKLKEGLIIQHIKDLCGTELAEITILTIITAHIIGYCKNCERDITIYKDDIKEFIVINNIRKTILI